MHLETLEVLLVCGGRQGGMDGPVAVAEFDGPVSAMESETGDIFILCCGGCTVRRLD
jgi:hypothetical protein